MGLNFLLSLLVSTASIVNAFCDSSHPPPEAIDAARALQEWSPQGMSTGRSAIGNENLIIPMYVHIIEAEQDIGFVTQKMFDDQMRVLNETYAPHRIQFALKGTTYTINDTWASSTRNKDKQEALRSGGYDDLNIYIESQIGTRPGSITGLCEFPVIDPVNTGLNGTSWSVWDGCHVGAVTMPGGPGGANNPGNDQGKTAVHEVGHWLGLFHVFQGFDCYGEGDLIDDTPVMLTASTGCNIGQDSCPDHEGLDPINNYMDYSSDECQTQFTPLQEERMYQSFNTLRRGKKF